MFLTLSLRRLLVTNPLQPLLEVGIFAVRTLQIAALLRVTPLLLSVAWRGGAIAEKRCPYMWTERRPIPMHVYGRVKNSGKRARSKPNLHSTPISPTPHSRRSCCTLLDSRKPSFALSCLVLFAVFWSSRQLAAGLRPRESYHFSRKTFHFSTIMAFAVLYSAKLPRFDFARGMAVLDSCVIASELARLRIGSINRALFR